MLAEQEAQIAAKVEALKGLSAAEGLALRDHQARNRLIAFLPVIHPLVAPDAEYINARHLHAIAWHVEQVVRGNIRRLAIAVPPRHFKSFVASVAAPTWILGQDPTQRVVCASYGSELSKRFSEQSRTVMMSAAYRHLFPGTVLSSKTPPVEKLITTKAGFRFATSIGGTLTGIGADIAVIDDPMKASEASSPIERENVHTWFRQSLMSRFDKPAEGRVIVVMQRLHQDDLIGRILAEEGWTYLRLPAEFDTDATIALGNWRWKRRAGDLLFPRRFDMAALAQLKIDLGEDAYNAQILQAPAPAGGAMVKRKWFQRYDTLPPKHQIELVVQVWDTALVDSPTADYSACTTWAISGKKLYLVDVLRAQMPYHQLKQTVIDHKAKFDASLVVVEQAGTGIILFQDVNQLMGHGWLKTIKAEVSKIERVAQQVGKIQRGRVYLPRSAPWLEQFEHEVGEFPFGRHDDQVDAMAHFLKIFDYGRQVSGLRDLRMYAGWQPGEPVL